MSTFPPAIGAALLGGDAAQPMADAPDSPGARDAALVRAARRGRSSAWTDLYHRYARTVHACVLARVPPADAEDLVQDVFAAAYRRLDTLESAERFGGWLLTIARNRAVDYWRRAKPTDELPDDLGRRSPPHLEAAEVLRAIRSLPPAYAEPLLMRLLEGLTGPEIAERTGMTHGSVRVNLSRGMKQLRELLEVSDDD